MLENVTLCLNLLKFKTLPALLSPDLTPELKQYHVKMCLMSVCWIANTRKDLPNPIKVHMDHDMALSRNATAHHAIASIFEDIEPFVAYMSHICDKYLEFIAAYTRDRNALSSIEVEAYGTVKNTYTHDKTLLTLSLVRALENLTSDIDAKAPLHVKTALLYDVLVLGEMLAQHKKLFKPKQLNSNAAKATIAFRHSLAHARLTRPLKDIVAQLDTEAYTLLHRKDVKKWLGELLFDLRPPTPKAKPESVNLVSESTLVTAKTTLATLMPISELKPQLVSAYQTLLAAVAETKVLHEFKTKINLMLIPLADYIALYNQKIAILNSLKLTLSIQKSVLTLCNNLSKLTALVHWMRIATTNPDALSTLTPGALHMHDEYGTVDALQQLTLLCEHDAFVRYVLPLLSTNPRSGLYHFTLKVLSDLLGTYNLVHADPVSTKNLNDNIPHLIELLINQKDKKEYAGKIFDLILRSCVADSAALLLYCLSNHPIERDVYIDPDSTQDVQSTRLTCVAMHAIRQNRMDLLQAFIHPNCDINMFDFDRGLGRGNDGGVNLLSRLAAAYWVLQVEAKASYLKSDIGICLIPTKWFEFVLSLPNVKLNDERPGKSVLARLLYETASFEQEGTAQGLSDDEIRIQKEAQIHKLDLLLEQPELDLNISISIYSDDDLNLKKRYAESPLLFHLFTQHELPVIIKLMTAIKQKGYLTYKNVLENFFNINKNASFKALLGLFVSTSRLKHNIAPLLRQVHEDYQLIVKIEALSMVLQRLPVTLAAIKDEAQKEKLKAAFEPKQQALATLKAAFLKPIAFPESPLDLSPKTLPAPDAP